MSTATQQAPTADQIAAQASFEAMFDHVPKVDLRTPRMVKEQAEREGWR